MWLPGRMPDLNPFNPSEYQAEMEQYERSERLYERLCIGIPMAVLAIILTLAVWVLPK